MKRKKNKENFERYLLRTSGEKGSQSQPEGLFQIHLPQTLRTTSTTTTH